MPNIMKGWKDFATTEDWIANTQVADLFALFTNTAAAETSVGSVGSNEIADIQYIIDNVAFDAANDEKLVYRSDMSVFKYSKSGSSGSFLIPSGSKVVKLGEYQGSAIVIAWNNNKYYKGIMPLSALDPVKTRNIVSPAGFLHDAKHTLFRFERRLQQRKYTTHPFANRMLIPLRQSIKDFEHIFEQDPKQAEAKLKNALTRYAPLLVRNNIGKVEIIQRHLNAIFSVNDFQVNGRLFSEQVRVLPLSLDWLGKYYDGNDEINLIGMFGGESGEGVKNADIVWQGFVSAIKHLLNVTANGEGKNTLEGRWLLENISPALLESTIKEIICIHNATWNFNALNDIAASGILLRDMHGPFFTSALFTVITHELNVNAFSDLFTPEDTHIEEDKVKTIQSKVIKEDYLTILTGHSDVNWEDALYRSHSYLSAISLMYIFKLIFT